MRLTAVWSIYQVSESKPPQKSRPNCNPGLWFLLRESVTTGVLLRTHLCIDADAFPQVKYRRHQRFHSEFSFLLDLLQSTSEGLTVQVS